MPVRRNEAGRSAWKRLSNQRWTVTAATLALGATALAGGSPLLSIAGIGLVLVVAACLPSGRSAPPRADVPARPGQALSALELAEAVDEPLILFDGNGILLHANRAARESFAIAGEGSAVTLKFRSPEMQQFIGDLLAGAIASGSVDYLERVPVERWFRATAMPLGRPAGLYLLAFRDQSELRRIDRMRADFIANASHELRTPLASVAGFIDTLRGPASTDDAARERFLGIMQQQTRRMARLIDDLLSLSRLEMKAPLRPSGTVELRALLAHVIDALEPMAAESGIAIHRPEPGPDLTVHGDRDELHQVFENLLENACKYGRSGGLVEVTLDASGEGPVAVTVRDHGPGIAEEHIPRLTERFYRVEAGGSPAQKGTGLGLAIVKHILARHRAELAIASKPGEGASFSVRLPRT